MAATDKVSALMDRFRFTQHTDTCNEVFLDIQLVSRTIT